LRRASDLAADSVETAWGALEPKEFALRVLRIYDTIGEERESVAGRKRENCLCVFAVGGNSKGQTGSTLDFLLAVAIGREMTGIWR
jgi:hypothetical protein